jgi:hypothetical protein
MARIKRLYILLFLMLLSMQVYSQDPVTAEKSDSPNLKRFMVIRTAPVFTLVFNFNYNQSMLELSGTYNDDFRSEDFINGETFGTDKGFGANVTSKLSLHKRGKLRLLLSASYNRIVTYMFGKSGLADIGETKFNIYTGGIGIENNFTPNYNFKLYAGGEFLASMINGKAVLWVSNQPNAPYSYNLKIKNGFRLGFSIYGGSEYMLSNNIGLNLGFKFTLANLFLKQSENSTDSTEIILNDGKPSVPGKYLGRKNFAYFTVLTGICFYWGVIEKRYELFDK